MPSPADILDAYTRSGRCLRATATILRVDPADVAGMVREAAAEYAGGAVDTVTQGATDLRILDRLSGDLAELGRTGDARAATAAIKAIEVARVIRAELSATIAMETGSDAERDTLAAQVQALIDARAEELAALTGAQP